MRALTVVGLKELQNETEFYPVLNANSNDIVDTKITNISLTIQKRI